MTPKKYQLQVKMHLFLVRTLWYVPMPQRRDKHLPVTGDRKIELRILGESRYCMGCLFNTDGELVI